KTGLEPAPCPDLAGWDPTRIDELLPQPHVLGRCDQAAPARKAEQLPRADALDRRSPAHRCPVIGHEHCTEPALLDDRERLGLTKVLLGVVPRGRHLPAKMSDRGVLFFIRVERIAEQLLGSVHQARQPELLLLPLTFGAD